jgi:hypothetical protein
VSFLLHFPRRKIFGITSVDSLNKFVIITVNMNQMRRVIQFVKRKLFSYSVSQDKGGKNKIMIVSASIVKLQTYDKVRSTNKQYHAKLSEITLKELAGNLGF